MSIFPLRFVSKQTHFLVCICKKMRYLFHHFVYPSYVFSSMGFCLFPNFFIRCLVCFISLVSKEVAFPVNLKKNLFLHPIVSPMLICAEVFAQDM